MYKEGADEPNRFILVCSLCSSSLGFVWGSHYNKEESNEKISLIVSTVLKMKHELERIIIYIAIACVLIQKKS